MSPRPEPKRLPRVFTFIFRFQGACSMDESGSSLDRTAFGKAELRDLKAISEKLFGMGITHQWTTAQAEDGSAKAIYTAGSGHRLLIVTKYADQPGLYLATGEAPQGAHIQELWEILEERVSMS